MTYKFINDDNSERGIPIGNYTSQYFANIYLDKLDKYVKFDLGIKYYVRYMDDFIILLKNKDKCINIMKKIESFLLNRLKLELNDKSRYYPNKMGVNFCGYRIFETHLLVRNRCKKIMKKKIQLWNNLYKNGELDTKGMILSFNSWLGHVRHVNSYYLVNRCIIKLDMYDIEGNNFICEKV